MQISNEIYNSHRRHRMLRLLVTLSLIFLTGFFLLASFAYGLPKTTGYLKQLTLFSAMSLTFAFIGMRMPEGAFQRLPFVVIPASWLSLLLLFIFGRQVNGAVSWFRFNGFSIQPSELAKPAFILLLATIFSHKQPNNKFMKWIWPYLLLLIGGLFIAPIILQPDLGTASVFAITLFAVFFACVRLSFSLATILASTSAGIVFAVTKCSHVLPRLRAYKDAFLLHPDVENAFHNYKLQESIIKGGWFGSGFGPRSGAVNLPLSYSDSFFAATVDMIGVISSIPIIFIYLAWLLYCLGLASRSTSMYNRLVFLAAGVMMTSQAFIHIGVNLGLLPITGLSMPLLGTGGSSFIACAIIITMVERLSMLEDEKSLTASDFSPTPLLENA